MLTDALLHILTPAVTGWQSRVEEAGGGAGVKAGVSARGGQLCLVKAERERVGEGPGSGYCTHGMQ